MDNIDEDDGPQVTEPTHQAGHTATNATSPEPPRTTNSATAGGEGDAGSERSLYAVLGVQPDASADDIVRAYRRQAVRLHPDRPTGNTAEFQKLQEAYEILSDPGKRRAYDKYGADGIQMLSQGNLTPIVQAIGIHTIVSISLFGAACVLACILAQLIVLAVRYDKRKDWSWQTTMAPTWVMDAGILITFLILGFTVIRNAIADKESRRVDCRAALIAPVPLLYIASTILAAIALETKDFGALVVVAPVLLAEALQIIASASSDAFSPKQVRGFLAVKFGVEPGAATVVAVIANSMYDVVSRLLLFLLLGLRVDVFGDGVHYFIFWVPLVVGFVFTAVANFAMAGLQIEAGKLTQGHRICNLLTHAIAFGIFIAGAALTSVKLQTDGDEPAALGVCFVPWFITLGYALLGTVGASCMFAASAKENLDNLEEIQRAADEAEGHGPQTQEA